MHEPFVRAAPIRSGDAFVVKSLHFTIWVAIGAFWPYVYLHYRDIGLSGTQIGLVVTLSSLVATLSAPLWGILNDRLGRIRLLFSLASLGAIVVCQVLSRWQSFVPILLTAGLLSVFTSPILPLLDSATLKHLGRSGENYGYYRLWGTVGFIIGVAASSLIMERASLRVIFPAYGLGVLLFWFAVLRLPEGRVQRHGVSMAGLHRMIRQPAWVLFAVSVFVLWFSVMGAFAFLGIVIKEMGGTEQTVGLSATVAAFTEIPLLLYSSRMLRRFGPVLLITVAMAVYGLRMALYALMPSIAWVPWLAMLQGFSYGPFLVGSVAYASQLAPDELKTTGQGLLVSVMSLANLAGGLAGGWLFDRAGKGGLYLTFTVTCLAALALFGAGWWRSRRSMQ